MHKLIAILFAAFLISPAMAEPKVGDVGPLSDRAFFCDTKAQIESIIQAGIDGGPSAIMPMYIELTKVINDKGEQACDLLPQGISVKVNESIALGDVKVGDEIIRTWIIQVDTQLASGWVLWGTAVDSEGI